MATHLVSGERRLAGSPPTRPSLTPRTLPCVTRPQTSAEVMAVIERYVDDAHRRVLRSTTDPARGLPRFKKKAEQAQDERVLRVLLELLRDVHPEVLDLERLQTASYERIDGAALAVQETRLRRRLQGIPEVAPSSLPQ